MQKNKFILALVAAMLSSALLYGCGSANPSAGVNTIPNTHGAVVSSVTIASLTTAQAANTALLYGLTGMTPRYNTTVYRVVYRTTDVNGNFVNASGLLLVPQKGGLSSPLLSYQHGTITLNTLAPSNGMSSESTIASVIASLGYVVMMPDYIGFGVSNTMLHPYLHSRTLAGTTIDMIRASKSLLAQKAVPLNGKLFLAGYSEGGYATMATQREIETNLTAEFTLTASEPGAGPYDMTNTTKTILAGASIAVPTYVGFVIRAYDAVYNNPSQLAAYINPVYVPFLNTAFNGTNSGAVIDAGLGGAGVATATLFNPVFLTNFASASGEAVLKANIAQNDIFNWKPAIPTRLFHGAADDVVPYANATTAATTMTANGALNVQVANCIPPAGLPADHNNCGLPYITDAKLFFDTMAPGL